jgi:hypothetical protein
VVPPASVEEIMLPAGSVLMPRVSRIYDGDQAKAAELVKFDVCVAPIGSATGVRLSPALAPQVSTVVPPEALREDWTFLSVLSAP